MKRLCLLLCIVLQLAMATEATADRLEGIYKDSRNTLTVVECTVEWSKVITDEVLIEAEFELRNDTEDQQIIRRVCMVVGDQWDLEDAVKTNPLERMNFLYTGKMEVPDYPGEYKDFWADMQTDRELIAKELSPGESVTAKFACILPRKKDVNNVEVLIMDMCDKDNGN